MEVSLLWGSSGTSLFDFYSLHHLVWFVAITTVLYPIFKKYVLVSAMAVAFVWEVFEGWVVSNVPTFPFAGNELFINKVIGDSISDLLGFLIAMLAIKAVRKIEYERIKKTGLEKR